MMVSDRDLTKQILQRDMLNLYRQLPSLASQLGFSVSPIFSMFEDKITGYINIGVDMVVDWLFGDNINTDIDEVSDIAKMMVTDKIEEYRKRVRQAKENEVL